MAKNWGQISEGTSSNTSSRTRSESEEFFDKVDTTAGEMGSMSSSLQVMMANSQRAAAAQAASAAPSIGMGMGGSSQESSSEDETS